MAKKRQHQRPPHDFRVTSVSWELENEARHREGGFEAVEREVILRRFFAFVDFLQQQGMTARAILHVLEEVSEVSELRNLDLTDEGFEFVQLYHGKWLNRLHQDRGDLQERAWLARCLQKFRDR